MKTHRNKPWFDQESSELANKRKQAKLIWLTNLNDQNAEDLTNIWRDICKNFRKKKRDCLKVKVNNLDEKSKTKNIQQMYKDTNEFKK